MDITFESSTNALATEINTSDLSSTSELSHEHRSAEAGAVVSDSSDDSHYCGYKVLDRIGSMIQLAKWSQELKDQQIIVSTAPRTGWGRNMPWADGLRGWRRNQTSVAEFCAAFAEPYISPDKDGHMFCGADLKDRARKKAEVIAICLMSFDSDVGQPDEDIIPRLQAAGHAYLKYTSHSNGKTNDAISLRALRKFDSTIGDIPTDDDLRRYLAGKRTKDGDIGSGRGYWFALAQSAKITAITGSGDATVLEFEHRPIHKFRVVLPLATPFVVTDDNRRQAEVEWKALYVHMAEQLGILYDPACTDLPRAFYLGRAKTVESYNCVIGGTAPLELPPVTPEMLERVNKGQPPRAKGAKKAKTGAKLGQHIRHEYFLNDEEFDVVSWLQAAGCETVGWGSHDKQTFVCPNVDEHTENKPDDVGCIAISPAVSDTGRAIIKCLHGHCKDMRTEDHLEMICEALVADDPNYPVPLISDHLMYFVDSFESTPADEVDEAPTAKKPAERVAPKFASLKKLLKSAKDSGFKVEGSYVVYKSPDDDYPKPVCQAFEVIGQARDTEKTEWGLLIEFEDEDKHSHRVLVSKADLHGKDAALRKKLAREGFDIRIGGGMFETLMGSLRPSARVLTVDRPGWVSDSEFVCPDGEVIGDGVGEIILLDNPLTGQRAGTLEGQLAAWKIAFAQGSFHHFVAAVAGAAGVLVQYINMETSPVMTLSGDSGAGKSSAMMLGAGVFGNPDIKKPGLLHSLRTTDNKSENTAARSTGTFLGYDETEHFEGDLHQFVFMIAGGVGKGRMKSNSSDQKTRTWSTFCLVSSEHALVYLIEQAGREANTGFTARCADLDCSGVTQIPKAAYDEMLALIQNNYGHLGPLFVAHVIAEGERLREGDRLGFEIIRDRIKTKTVALVGGGATALIERAANVFSVLWQTGEMLQAAGLLPECNVEQRIREIWEAYHHSDEARALIPGDAAVDRLRNALYARHGRDVHDIDADSPHYAETVAWFKQDGLTVTYFVRADKIVEISGGARKRRSLTSALKEAEILKPSGDKTLTWDKLPGGFKMQHYRLAFKLDPEVAGPFAG
jgi:hypothetical protein